MPIKKDTMVEPLRLTSASSWCESSRDDGNAHTQKKLNEMECFVFDMKFVENLTHPDIDQKGTRKDPHGEVVLTNSYHRWSWLLVEYFQAHST